MRIFSDLDFLVYRQNLDSVFMKENTDQRKPIFWHILCTVTFHSSPILKLKIYVYITFLFEKRQAKIVFKYWIMSQYCQTHFSTFAARILKRD